MRIIKSFTQLFFERSKAELRRSTNGQLNRLFSIPLRSTRTITEIALLIVIVCLGAFLRLHKLDTVPNGFYADEAAIGYNAFSILETGKDEYGKVSPIYFRSFGDYKIPLYIYLTTIPVYFFGLTVFATRFLSAISGIGSIIMIYFVLRKIPLRLPYVPLIGSFLFAIVPWSIYFSRGAYEANLAFLLLLVAVYCFFESEMKPKYFLVGTLILSLSTYAYHSERLIAYLFLPAIVVMQMRSTIGGFLRARTKSESRSLTSIVLDFARTTFTHDKIRVYLIACLLFVLTQLPHLYVATKPAFALRATGLFYSDAVNDQAKKLATLFPQPLAVTLAFAREFLAQFTAYFSPHNLFFNADSERERSIPEISVFYFWMVVPYIIGFFYLLKHIGQKYFGYTAIMMVTFAVIPALTKDPFSSIRSMPLLLPFLILICLGIDVLLASRLRLTILSATPLILLLSGLLFWRSYFVLFPNERATTWGYGYQQLANEIAKRHNEHFIIDQGRIKPAYIELAFFLKIPPEELQKSVDQTIKDHYYTNVAFDQHYIFGNVETRPIMWEPDIYRERILVGDALSISNDQAQEHALDKLFEIRDPLDTVIFQAYYTNPKEKCRRNTYVNIYCQQ